MFSKTLVVLAVPLSVSVLLSAAFFLIFVDTSLCAGHKAKKNPAQSQASQASPAASSKKAAVAPAKNAPASTASREIFLDAVVASVDGKPITLLEIESHLATPRTLSLSEAAQDMEARQVLDSLIQLRLIEAEAETRKLKVSDEDINNYVNEVSRRNKLSPQALEQALIGQNKTMADYREEVRIDILRARLTSQLAQSGFGVTRQEVEKYIKEHPEFSKSGSKSKLRQIFVSFQGKTPEEAKVKIDLALQELNKGTQFSSVASQYSEGPEAAEGGSLGVVAEGDLSPAVFDAVFSTKPGEISPVVEGPDGLKVFYVEKRFVEQGEQPQELYDEVKKSMERAKLEEKVQEFFASGLQKNHSVDKKI
jgi:peptidyl-prolyl cis-trans isomerase SurA